MSLLWDTLLFFDQLQLLLQWSHFSIIQSPPSINECLYSFVLALHNFSSVGCSPSYIPSFFFWCHKSIRYTTSSTTSFPKMQECEGIVDRCPSTEDVGCWGKGYLLACNRLTFSGQWLIHILVAPTACPHTSLWLAILPPEFYGNQHSIIFFPNVFQRVQLIVSYGTSFSHLSGVPF